MKYNKKCIIAVMLLTVIILQTGCAAPKFGKMYKQRNNTETAADKTGIESDKSKDSGTEAAEKEELEETEYRRGNIEGNHFESEWMNLKIDIPEFYVVLTQEEMDKAYNDGKEFMDEGSANFFQYKLEKGGIIYEMTAVSTTARRGNINILVENTGMVNITTKQLASAAKANLENGMSEEAVYSLPEEPFPVEIAGEEFYCLQGTLEIQGMMLHSDLYVRAKDGYSIEIGTTYTDDGAGQIEELIAAIQPYAVN